MSNLHNRRFLENLNEQVTDTLEDYYNYAGVFEKQYLAIIKNFVKAKEGKNES